MKKRACVDCGEPMTSHTIGRINGRLLWLCPQKLAKVTGNTPRP